MLGQGTDEHERVGDEIIGQRINYKIWLSNKLDRPNVTYFFFTVLWYIDAPKPKMHLKPVPWISMKELQVIS